MTSMVAPFSVRNGKVVSTTDPSVVASSKIIKTLTTTKGERTGIPNFGASITSFLFQNVDELTSADFRVDAIQELKGRISGVTIFDVSISPDKQAQNQVNVSVIYKLPLSSPQVTAFRVAIPGEVNEESSF